LKQIHERRKGQQDADMSKLRRRPFSDEELARNPTKRNLWDLE
jgi:hypothetical protein